MKSIQIFRAIAYLILLSVFVACGNEPQPGDAQAGQAAQNGEAGKMAPGGQPSEDQMMAGGAGEIDPSFLAMQEEQFTKILQGKWQSAADASEAIEFSGNKLIRTKSGKVTGESTFEISTDCSKSECKGGAGWCFIEKKDSENQCNNVLRVDQAMLQFRVLGEGGSELTFNKMN